MPWIDGARQLADARLPPVAADVFQRLNTFLDPQQAVGRRLQMGDEVRAERIIAVGPDRHLAAIFLWCLTVPILQMAISQPGVHPGHGVTSQTALRTWP